MRQTIFAEEVRTKLLKRLDQLTHDSKPQWGIMSVCQMLHHLTMSFRVALGELEVPDRSTFFRRTVVKWLALLGRVPSKKFIAKQPIRTYKEINIVKQGIHTDDFQTEKSNLQQIIERFLFTEKLAPHHPLIGKMSRKDWGYWGYSHVNYHLTQFSV